MNRSLRTLLIASLLINLLLAGMLIGRVGQGLLPPGKTSPQEVVAGLPKEVRIIFDDALAKTKLDIAPIRAELDGTRRAALCILNRETFDHKAYLATTERLHSLHGTLAKRMNLAVTQISPKLPPKARIAFVDLLRQPPPPRDLAADCGETTER